MDQRLNFYHFHPGDESARGESFLSSDGRPVVHNEKIKRIDPKTGKIVEMEV